MVDESKNEALQELNQESPEQEVIVQQEEQQQQHEETQAELNFKAMRAEKERMQRENDRLQKERDEALRYAHEYQMRMNPPQQQQNYTDYNSLKPDDLVEAKYVQQEFRRMKEELEQTKQQMQTGIIEAQLKTKYTDFDDVVSKDNLEALKDTYPDIYKTIYTSQDLYAKGSSAYQLIKKFVMTADSKPNYTAEKTRIAQNAAKPRNINSIKGVQTGSALDKANAFAAGDNSDPAYRKQVLEHMQKHAATHSIKFNPL